MNSCSAIGLLILFVLRPARASALVNNGDLASKSVANTTLAPYNCPEKLFGCMRLSGELDCHDKKLTCIEPWNKPLEKYSTVKTLNYKSNKITHLPTRVFERQIRDRTRLAEDVTFLDLSFNELSRIDADAFAGLTSLEVLSLVANNLQNVPTQAFSGLKRLRKLQLRLNPITMISPQAFSPLKALENLELSYCHITTISPDAFQGLRSLTHLDLAHNRLDSNSITRYSFVGLPALGTVKLANNKETFRLRDINWMEAFGISAGGQILLRRSDEEEEEDYGDLMEFKTSSSDTTPDYYEVPCKCKRLNSDSPDTTTCPLIWKFFKANMTLECVGKARQSESSDDKLRGESLSTELMTKSDQEPEVSWSEYLTDIVKIFFMVLKVLFVVFYTVVTIAFAISAP